MTTIPIIDLRVDGLGVDTMSHLCPGLIVGSAEPVFSWKLSAGIQRACRVTAASEPDRLSSPDLWDSGWCFTRNSTTFPYAGKALTSRQRVYLRVFVELEDGRRGESEVIEFTVGLLSPEDWCGKWIYADGFEHLSPAPVPYFRRNFSLSRSVRRALLFSTARGLLEVTLNEKRVDEHDFLPGWSDFRKVLQYTVYDVTSLLERDGNVLGVILGDGWYVASFPGYNRNIYGTIPTFQMQLELEYEDGSRECIVSDKSWRWNYGGIMSSDLYDGEEYNGKRCDAEYFARDFDDSSWRESRELPCVPDGEQVQYVRKLMPGVSRAEILEPVAKKERMPGVWIYDFGRIITGRVRLRLDAPANAVGLRGYLSYAEVLNPDGSLYNVNYRNAACRDSYVVGPAQNEWESHFTFHGFRYVQLENLPIREFGIRDIRLEAVVLTSDLRETGTFTCGFPPLNQLAENIRCSMRGNLLEIPMDCPQRDERMGWSGDAHIFFQTAMFLADGRNFYRKYLQDLRCAQREDGAICSVAPPVPGFIFGSPGWADALPIIAWGLYLQSGDLRIIRENYEAVKRHLRYEATQATDFLLEGHCDHLSSAQPPTDRRLIGTVFFHRSAEIAAAMAERLERGDEAKNFRELARRIRRALHRNFLTEGGVLKERTQCGFSLLFYFDLFDSPEQKTANAVSFRELILEHGKHLETGFLGTAYLCPSLVKAGLSDLACDLLLQRSYPSWLFEVDQGATTIWERWDSYHPDRGFASPAMNSFNHYANGAVGEFIFSGLGGVFFQAVDEDGTVAPRVHFRITPDPRIGFARAVLETPCGKAASEWHLDGECLRWHGLVPPNTIGILEGFGGEELLPGEYDFSFHVAVFESRKVGVAQRILLAIDQDCDSLRQRAAETGLTFRGINPKQVQSC